MQPTHPTRSTRARFLPRVVAVLAALALAAPSQAAKYDGVEINIMTFTGPQIAEPLQRRAPDFRRETGAQVNIITVPFSDLYTKLLTDWAAGANSVDAAVFAPQWMGDYVEPGYLEDLTDRVAADPELRADDIAPFFRNFSQQYKGRTWLLTLDGDFQMAYYRIDALEQLGMPPPETWEDYIAVARAAHGRDWNGDGQADYGSCISKKRGAQAYWAVMSVAGGFLQSQGTGQGGFFNPETMEPLIDNEAFIRALEIYKETTQYAPPDEINLDVGDTRALFTQGRCALTVDWGDTGTLAIEEGSKVNDKTGAVPLPGSREVLDRANGRLVPCDAARCPHAVNGVNRAPYAAFGGWSGGVNSAADEKTKAAAYDFFSFMSRPAHSNEDVTIGQTGFNPYRLSQFQNLDNWTKAGMSERAARNYLGAIGDSLASPNMMLDLRIPQNQRYQQIVLDTAIARMLAGELTPAEAAEIIHAGWEEITGELGRDEQKAAYRASLGLAN